MRPLLLTGLLLTAAFAGCISSGDDASGPAAGGPVRLTQEQWVGNLTKEVYAGIVSTVHSFDAADGTHLTLTLHLPQGLEAGKTVPALVEFTPYNSFLDANYDLPQAGTPGPSSSWSDYVLRGAAYVEADERGTSGSAGCLDFGGSRDRSDAQDFVAWIRAQPWSNGVIVTDGVSHPGMGSVVAHAAVADLAGAVAHAPVVSYYRDEWYQGAKFEDQANGPAYQAVELSPAVYADPASLAAQAAPCTGDTTTQFSSPDGRFTDLWDDRDLARHHDAATAPILLTQGFIDQNVHPDHVQSYWEALPDDFPKSVIWGYWYHGYPDMSHHPLEDFELLRHRWLDRLLFGADNGLAAEPRVLVEDSTHVWHEGHDWPLEPSETVTWFADGDAFGPVAGEDGSALFSDLPTAERGVWADGTSAVFTSAPLHKDMLVNGAPTVELHASSTRDQTKWVAYLLDVAPDGTRQRISHGYADSHTHAGEAEWAAMSPGTPYAWFIRLMPTAVVVAKGHSIALVVASEDSHNLKGAGTVSAQTGDGFCFSDYVGGCYDPSGILPATTAGDTVNRVLTGPTGTRVTFAWVEPALTAIVPGSGPDATAD